MTRTKKQTKRGYTQTIAGQKEGTQITQITNLKC